MSPRTTPPLSLLLRILRLALGVLVACGSIAFATEPSGGHPAAGPSATPPARMFSAAPRATPPQRPGPPHKAAIALSAEDGSRGPIVLTPRDGTYTGTFMIENTGGEPLAVS